MYNIPVAMLGDNALTANSKLIYSFICEHCNLNARQNLSYDKISSGTATTQMTVIRSVKLLVKEGWLRVVPNGRGWNCYETFDKKGCVL